MDDKVRLPSLVNDEYVVDDYDDGSRECQSLRKRSWTSNWIPDIPSFGRRKEIPRARERNGLFTDADVVIQDRASRRRRLIIRILLAWLIVFAVLFGLTWTVRRYIYQEVTAVDFNGKVVRHVNDLRSTLKMLNIEEDSSFVEWAKRQKREPITKERVEAGWIPVSIWKSKGGDGEDGTQWNVSMSELAALLRRKCPGREKCVCMSAVELGILTNVIYLGQSDEILNEPVIIAESSTMVPVRFEFGDEFTSTEKLKNIDFWHQVPDWITVQYRKTLLDRRRFVLEEAACILASLKTVNLAQADEPSLEH